MEERRFEQSLEQLKERVHNEFYGEGSGHDWWHIHRVYQLAVRIGEAEKADPTTVRLAALLHDVGDHKFHGGDETMGGKLARKYMEEAGIDDSPLIEKVCEIVDGVSFKGAHVSTEMKTIEGKSVQDADRLDAIGAIGIARTFAYGGHKDRQMYDPEVKPTLHADFESYKKSDGPTINHFYEKLLLLKNTMGTETGRKIAEERHDFMLEYLDRFYKEWDGII
ncbi:phosphohydrolase [Fulvitalea axinellae]|uniref:Phosphohydrolase n=1 Tax=Fulvitalea axinellae TaxID=1182444 RepID=A0AAU9CIH3_9BACT|nr:phosphohydrolase [Fulvitalea axinellae]